MDGLGLGMCLGMMLGMLGLLLGMLGILVAIMTPLGRPFANTAWFSIPVAAAARSCTRRGAAGFGQLAVTLIP